MAFVATVIRHDLLYVLGVIPQAVVERFWIWQPITYMFMHAGPTHILFNMLGIWMFGVELERLWGTKFFVRYYAVTGIGAAITTILVSFLPFEITQATYRTVTVGASGALFGILLAFALYYPDRPILMALIFPIPAKYFVIIIGALSYFSSPGGVRARGTPGRVDFRLPLPPGWKGRAHGGNQVPISEVEDEPSSPQIRRCTRAVDPTGTARCTDIAQRRFLAWLAAGLLIRLIALPLEGTEDVLVWKTWSYGALHQGVSRLYGVGGHPPERGLVRWGDPFHDR